MPSFTRAHRVLSDAVASGVTPCAVVEAGSADAVLWSEAFGRLTFDADADAATPRTVFDLASLTKVLATTAIAMRLSAEGRLNVEARVSEVVPAWRGSDRDAVRIVDLLAHSSGLPAYRPLHKSRSGRAQFEAAICAEPLEYPPGTASLYSDLGFILLGFLLEDVAGASLDGEFHRTGTALPGERRDGVEAPAARPEIQFCPPAAWLERVAPTRPGADRRGLVDDENARALGGVAGHAGLFGTAAGVGAIARGMLRALIGRPGTPGPASPATVVRFVSRAGIPGSSRALGWDTMLPTSSCGTLMSARAFGHTGFTGTSLWIDPAAGVYVVLLTNRVYPSPGSTTGISSLRVALHDAVMAEGGFSNRQV